MMQGDKKSVWQKRHLRITAMRRIKHGLSGVMDGLSETQAAMTDAAVAMVRLQRAWKA